VLVRRVEVAASECPQPRLPDPRPTLDLARPTTKRSNGSFNYCDKAAKAAPGAPVQAKQWALLPPGKQWALLLPVTSRGSASQAAF
jgi:hypothetical protein